MPAKETATALIDGVFDVLGGDAAYKADVAGEIVDQLIGSDPHALVKSVANVSPDMVEVVSDVMIRALKQAIVNKLNGA